MNNKLGLLQRSKQLNAESGFSLISSKKLEYKQRLRDGKKFKNNVKSNYLD